MIIRKKGKQTQKQDSSVNKKTQTKKNIIKKEDVILDSKDVKDTNASKELPMPDEPLKVEKSEALAAETFEKIDISSIDFKERIERRRGDRRRGYRRIDERSLVTRAQQEAHTIKELAAREGYQNGLKKAEEEIANLKSSLCEFLSLRDEMHEKFYPHIMEISLEIAKKIIKQEVETSHEILKNIVMTVLDELNSDTQKIEIKVSPDDFEFAKISLPELIESKKISARIAITQDNIVDRGSCIVIANNGVIDANFKTQLAVLQNAFGIYKGGV